VTGETIPGSWCISICAWQVMFVGRKKRIKKEGILANRPLILRG